MTRRGLLNRDASDRAGSELDYIIKREDLSADNAVSTVSPQQAMLEKRIVEDRSDRDVTRVLFISRNTDLLNPAQQSLDGYINISELFDEVHILILRQGIPSKKPVLRVAHNVWIYTATAKHWWLTPAAGMQIVREQLEFGSGFRPDLIVARDPFESAITAHKIGLKYGRPTQLHVVDDVRDADFTKKNFRNFWRKRLFGYAVPKFKSVRTLTNSLHNYIEDKFDITDLAVLPRYQNYEALIGTKKIIDLKHKYQPLIFFVLFVGDLNYQSTLYQVIDAARFVLKNPRIGLVVLGDGVAKSEFEKRAKVHGIEKQVIFEKDIKDIVPYLKSANILVVSDITSRSEELVLQGAAAGIPVVMTETDVRRDIFVDGDSAFLCLAGDTQAFSDRINDLLNDVHLRNKFIESSQDMIKNKFHHDPSEYQESYRDSIEQAFFLDEVVD